MGFHLSNLFCRFKRTGFFCLFFLFVLFVCFVFFSQSFRNRHKKQENLCDIEVFYSLDHDIGTLASWSQKRTAILYLFSFSLKG